MDEVKITAVRLDPAGEALVAGTSRGRVEVISLVSGVRDERFAPAGALDAEVRCLDVSFAGQRVLAGSRDGTLRVWDSTDGVELARIDVGEPPVEVVLRSPTEFAAVGAERGAYLWRLDDEGVRGGRLTALDGSPLLADALASPSEDFLVLLEAFGWRHWQMDQLRFAGLSGGATDRPVAGRAGELRQAVSPRGLMYDDGRLGLSRCGRALYVYWDDYLLFDVRSGRRLHEGPAPHHPISAALSTGARRLALGTAEGEVVVTTGRGEDVCRLRPTTGRMHGVDFDDSGRLVAWRDQEGRAGVIDGAAGREILTAAQVAEALAETGMEAGDG